VIGALSLAEDEACCLILRARKRTCGSAMTPFGSDVSIFLKKKQIYLVNTPMVFRAVWTVVKPWLHPLTVNKIQV
jgi:hypothetical protein